MRELIILSDLWGLKAAPWVQCYVESLSEIYGQVSVHDSCVLANIDPCIDEKGRHQQFINGGASHAVKVLCERQSSKVDVLGFSIGGTIGWQFALKSPWVARLLCLSSTRLRKQKNKPDSDIRLYFGEHDDFKPDGPWHESMHLSSRIINGHGHEFYRDMAQVFAPQLVKELTIVREHE